MTTFGHHSRKGTSGVGCIVVLLVCAMMGSAHAQLPAEQIVAYFDSLDHSMEATAGAEALRSANIKVTDRYLKSLLGQQPAIVGLLRVSSKGKVISEVARDGKVGKRLRSVTTQEWYSTAGPGMEPHYSNIKSRKGAYQLLWARPVTTPASNGGKRSNGVLVVKLDLVKCLTSAAQSVNTPFMVELDGKVIYKQKWRDVQNVESSLFDIRGLTGLNMRYESRTPAPAAVPAVQPVAAPQAPVVSAQVSEPLTPPKRKSGMGSVLLVIFLVLMLGGLLYYLFGLVRKAMEEKHLRVMREIDGETDEPPDPATVRGPARRPLLPVPPAAANESAAVMRGPVAPQDQAANQGTGRITSRIPFPVPGTPGGTALPPMASAQTPSGPTRALASGASVSVDDYEKVRQQIRNEVLPEIRQQLQNEFELFRKEVERDAEGLSTETQMLLHQLIGKLSEMGDDSTGIVNTVSATIHELHLSLQHFKEQQTPLPKV